MKIHEKFDALGHRHRLRIFRALMDGPLCVCEINELLDLSQPAVSQHLSRLRHAGLVASERRGQWTFYSVGDKSFEEVVHQLSDVPCEDLDEALDQIKRKNLCDLRTDRGQLSEESNTESSE